MRLNANGPSPTTRADRCWPLPGSGLTWTCVRKAKEGEITADVFSFLTCQPNLEIAKPHPKGMPVILTTERSMMSRCGHHGIKPNRYNDPCQTNPSDRRNR
jgi:hypothetical protein